MVIVRVAVIRMKKTTAHCRMVSTCREHDINTCADIINIHFEHALFLVEIYHGKFSDKFSRLHICGLTYYVP